MSYQSQPFQKTRVFQVTNTGDVRGLDEETPISPSAASTIPVVRAYASGAPISTRFSATSSPGDNFGHYRESEPTLTQEARAYGNSTLQKLSPFKVRDLFQSQAARLIVSRKDVLKQTQRELYVPRTGKLLKQDDFNEFTSAANAYAATMANTTAGARAKAAARAASLAAGGTNGTAGAGGGATATVAAATASALAASDPTKQQSLNLPIIPDTIDAFELGKAAATEAYLQDIWNENRNKEASDERLRKHIKKLVHEWSAKLARFEEEVQRRQEDTYYAKFRRQDNLAKSMNNLDELKAEESKTNGHPQSLNSARAAMRAQHHPFAEDHLLHHRRDAFTVTSAGKVDHQDKWTMGTDLAIIDTKALKVNKELAKKRKQLLDHQMAHSICASTLAAPPQPSSLSVILAGAQAGLPVDLNGTGFGSIPERTHQTFSSFRPTTTPAQRQHQSVLDAHKIEGSSVEPTPRPASQPNKLPQLPGASVLPTPPLGLSVRQTRPPPFAGLPGHGHPLNAQLTQPHIFSSPDLAQTAGITRPEYQPISTHVKKRLELLDVERIKHRLATEKINVPRGTLERALVPPEIQFSSEQQQNELPTPFFGLPTNPFENQKKKGKKKKKGSKKKK